MHALNSEHAQSALCLFLDPHWLGLVVPIIVPVHIHLGIGYFKARGIQKVSIPDMIKIELTNIPVKSETVYPDVDCLLYGPG